MELILQKVCGRSAQLPIRLRRCGPADAAAFFALQNEVRAAMPHPEQFVPDTLENITAYLREDLCIGAYDGERLGAYFILRYCGRSAHNYAAFLGVPREEWEHWVNADSAVVHPDSRTTHSRTPHAKVRGWTIFGVRTLYFEKDTFSPKSNAVA